VRKKDPVIITISEITVSPVAQIADGVWGASPFGPMWSIAATSGDDVVLVIIERDRKSAMIKFRKALDSLEATGVEIKVPESWSDL